MRKKLAFELLKIARELLGMEFDTEAEKKKYQQEHDVRPSTKLTVKKSEPAKSKSPDKASINDMSSLDFDWKKAEKAAGGVYSKNRLEVDRQKEILRKILGDEADAVMASVDGYVDDGYKNVNGYLRDNKSVQGEELEQAKKQLAGMKKYLDAMPKLPVGTFVYRGTTMPTPEVEKMRDSVQSGHEVILSDAGIASTSLNPWVGFYFSKRNEKVVSGGMNVVMQIKQKRGVLLGGASLSTQEKEVLLPPGKLRVTGFHYRSNYVDKGARMTETLEPDGFVILVAEEV